MKKKVIQVGGSVRSGTTMTALVLANQKNAIALGEVMHLFYPIRKKYIEKVTALKKDARWNRIISDSRENLYKNIFKEFPHINVILDSSKDPFWFKEAIKNIGEIDVYRIVTYKHPNDLKTSFEKRDLNNWSKVYTNYYKRFYTVFPETQSVMLDKLLREDGYLKKLCNDFGLEYSDDKLNYWTQKQPNFFGSQTIKKNRLENTLHTDKGDFEDPGLKSVFTFLNSRDVDQTVFNANTFSYNKLTIQLYWIKDYFLKKKLLKLFK